MPPQISLLTDEYCTQNKIKGSVTKIYYNTEVNGYLEQKFRFLGKYHSNILA